MENQKSPLEIAGEQARAALLPKNNYAGTGPYSSSHKNALSDGDDLGKGENSGNVGSKTDIMTRTENTKSNKYNDKNTYPNF